MVPEGCEADVVRLLSQLSRRPVVPDGDPEAALDSRQNAEIVAGAERYCRTMVGGDGESWNVRDHHMTDTLERLMDHHGGASKAVVWEHNSHIGDAPGRRTWRGLAWSTSGSSSGSATPTMLCWSASPATAAASSPCPPGVRRCAVLGAAGAWWHS